MKRMVKAGLALGMAFCLTVSGMALPVEVSAKKKAVKPKKITLNVKKKTLTKKGQTFKIKIKKVTPKKASKKVSDFKFKSSNKKVATVSKKGVIKAVKNGSCKVTVTSKKNKKAKKTITVKVQIKSTPNPTQQPPVTTVAPTTAPGGQTNPPAGQTNPPTDKTNPPVDKTNPPADKTNPPADKTNPPTDKTNPPTESNDPTTPPTESNDPTTPPTSVPVQPGEKEIDGVLFKTYPLDAGYDYAISTKRAGADTETTEIPVKDLPNLLGKITNIAGTYERWMELGSYTKKVNKVTYKIETPDNSKMEEKTVTVTGSDNARLNGVFDVKLTVENGIYTAVIEKQDSDEDPLNLTIADGEDEGNVVISGTYNEAAYRVVVAKDNSKVELFKESDRLAQITKQADGYEMDLKKAEVESRNIVVEKLQAVVEPGETEEPTTPPTEEPTTPPTEEPTTPPTEEPTPAGPTPLNVKLAPETEGMASSLEAIYDESGVTYGATVEYGGGGVAYKVNDVDLTKYKEVVFEGSCNGSSVPVVPQLFKGTNVWQDGLAADLLTSPVGVYVTTPTEAGSTFNFRFGINQDKAAALPAGTLVTGVRLKYNAGGKTRTESFNITSIKFIGNDGIDDIDVEISKEAEYLSNSLGPVYGESGVTFCAMIQYGGGAYGVKINEDGSAADLSKFKEVEIVVSSSNASVPVVAGIFKGSNLFDHNLGLLQNIYQSTNQTAGADTTLRFPIDQTKVSELGDGQEPTVVALKYNADKRNTSETFTVKSIRFIPNEDAK